MSLFRCFDILAGLSLFLSFLSLQVGAKNLKTAGIGLFLVLSCGVLVTYWVWVVYLKYGRMEMEASKEVSNLRVRLARRLVDRG